MSSVRLLFIYMPRFVFITIRILRITAITLIEVDAVLAFIGEM